MHRLARSRAFRRWPFEAFSAPVLSTEGRRSICATYFGPNHRSELAKLKEFPCFLSAFPHSTSVAIVDSHYTVFFKLFLSEFNSSGNPVEGGPNALGTVVNTSGRDAAFSRGGPGNCESDDRETNAVPSAFVNGMHCRLVGESEQDLSRGGVRPGHQRHTSANTPWDADGQLSQGMEGYRIGVGAFLTALSCAARSDWGCPWGRGYSARPARPSSRQPSTGHDSRFPPAYLLLAGAR
jgi:hypothetical protein